MACSTASAVFAVGTVFLAKDDIVLILCNTQDQLVSENLLQEATIIQMLEWFHTCQSARFYRSSRQGYQEQLLDPRRLN